MTSTTTTQDYPYRRQSICVGCPQPETVVHQGQDSFCPTIQSLYAPSESTALEQLVNLKADLQTATSSNDFYNTLSQGLTAILGAQFVFVSKRIINNVDEPAVEMPPLGEPGSCLMALSWYYNDGHGTEGNARDVTYHAFSCPCAYMRHDKVFLVPNGLSEFAPENPNSLPFPCEAYIGIPLFFQGKCIAHFGIMWSAEGNTTRKLGWGYIEMMCHALEDLILQQVLKSSGFGQPIPEVDVVPHNAVDSNQSLKTYARCLSHELRTPMHGVVGMLDIMYATVQEAAESNGNPADKRVFQTLKDNIELVQVSSRRAVEAADNVVQAYDLGMGHLNASSVVPDMYVSAASHSRPVASPIQGTKRRPSWATHDSPAKHRLHNRTLSTQRTQSLAKAVKEANRATRVQWGDADDAQVESTPPSPASTSPTSHPVGRGPAYSNIREIVEYVVKESLRIGKGFDSAVAKEIEGGQIIEVVTHTNNGQRNKRVEWTVDCSVPEILWLDEKDFAKLVSCVIQNALKFTDEGRVTIRVTTTRQNLIVGVSDTGPGIPESFRPNIFKPFSREDHTITRHNEGLGLGLLVAKGLSRKLRGDLNLVRCSTEGPDHGSEFEITLPFSESSRSTSPEIPIAPKAADSPHHSAAPEARQMDALTQIPILSKIPTMPHHGTPATSNAKIGGKFSKTCDNQSHTRNLAVTHPLTFLVAEDNNISRKILVNMLVKLGYDAATQIYQAADGTEAVKHVAANLGSPNPIELIIMDLWMPSMDGYEASERILGMYGAHSLHSQAKRSFSEPDGFSMAKAGTLGQAPTILAVTADATDGVAQRAIKAGMEGFMVKPFKIKDLERLIRDGWARRNKSASSTGAAATAPNKPIGSQMEVVPPT